MDKNKEKMLKRLGRIIKKARIKKYKSDRSLREFSRDVDMSHVAVKNIENSMLDELVVTDTIPLRSEAKTSDRIRQLSVAGMLAESIRRIAEGESLSSMFLD